MNAARPDVVSGRRSSGAVPAWPTNIPLNTTSMITGVNRVIFISGARIHERNAVSATPETRSVVQGSRDSTNLAARIAGLAGPADATATAGAAARRPVLKSPVYRRSVVP